LADLKVLVTGGAGFIGSHLVRLLLGTRPEMHVVNLDLLTYAGEVGNLGRAFDHPRHTFVQGDIRDASLMRKLMRDVDGVLNLAAETHVDRSIRSPEPFVETNVVGTRVLLDAALEADVGRFVQVSTDEVYGQLAPDDPEEGAKGPQARFSEDAPLRPRSPYSASKAAADLLALSYHHTFGMDVVIPRGANNYGPNQHREKLIPLLATAALNDSPLPLYGDGLHVRDWIYVGDFCRGILAAFDQGRPGGIYNFGGGEERTNLEVARAILEILGKPAGLIRFVSDRPGHDRRYAMDSTRALEELGWRPQGVFGEELARTVDWYRRRAGAEASP